MDLITIIKVLLKRKWLLIGIPIVAGITAFLFTLDFKKTYRSTAQLSTGFTISDEVQITAERFNLYEADVKFNNLIETMNSSRVMSLLSYRLLIHDLQNPSKAFRSIDAKKEEDPVLNGMNLDNMLIIAQAKLDSLAPINTYIETDQRLKKLLEAYEYDFDEINDDINISRIRNTDYVSVNAYSEDPFLSAFMVNTLCSEFLRYNQTVLSDRSTESVSTFKKLVEQKKAELEEKSEKLRQFKSNNSLLNFSAESESKISQLSELETSLDDEQRKLRTYTLQLEDVDAQIRRAGGSLSTSNSNIVDLKKKISLLNQKYISTGSNNPKLLDSLNELRTEQQRLIIAASSKTNNSDELKRLNDRKNDLEVNKLISQQNIDAIKGNIYRLRRNVGGYATKEAQISALQREVDVASEDYKNAQEKYNKSLDVSLASRNSINQILIGLPPSEPEPSKRLIITGLSGASTFILCVLVIIFLEYIDVSIKDVSNFKKKVDLQLIGFLNTIPLKKQSLVHLFKTPTDGLDKSKSVFRESLRKIRFQIENQKRKIYLVTSLKPSEGKSVIIESLSLALSTSGHSVLMIDFNFSNNILTRKFGANTHIEKILNPKSDKINITVTKTRINGVDIIGCMGGNYTPSEIFEMNKISVLLNTLKDKYDFIFIEGACLNRYSDSREISSFVEGIITIFSAESILKTTDYESIDFIKSLKNKNCGAILNKIEKDNMNV
ncbi:exopolysaccharide transport family protein [Marivirga sp.]|uniref:exopolysaccharide transport family protein n=1 Tax=Marivirga sp. TaxID=2018662 RepID=UPI003DA6D864